MTSPTNTLVAPPPLPTPVSQPLSQQRRRTSVAIAVVGNPEVVIMDEPTTGVDAYNRRDLWKIVAEVKKDRAVIVTTHAMEEADVLGDRVAMMVGGELCCIGTPVHLKQKYGVGYRITLTTDMETQGELHEAVMARLPSARLASAAAGSVVYTASPAHVQEMRSLIEFLEREGAERRLVREWGVTQSTLDDVFVNVSSAHGFVYSELVPSSDGDGGGEGGGAGASATTGQSGDFPSVSGDSINGQTAPVASATVPARRRERGVGGNGRSPSRGPRGGGGGRSYQFRALLRKNLTLQKRQFGNNCCQILIPVSVMVILVILQLILRTELGVNVSQRVLVPSTPWPLNGVTNVSISLGGVPTGHDSFPALVAKSARAAAAAAGSASAILQRGQPWLTADGRRKADAPGTAAVTAPGSNHTVDNSSATCYEFFLVSPPEDANHGANEAARLWDAVPRRNCTLYNGTVVPVPGFEARANLTVMNTEVFDDLQVGILSFFNIIIVCVCVRVCRVCHVPCACVRVCVF